MVLFSLCSQNRLCHRQASGPGWGSRGGQQPEAEERGPGCGNAAGRGAERDGHCVPRGEGPGPGAAGSHSEWQGYGHKARRRQKGVSLSIILCFPGQHWCDPSQHYKLKHNSAFCIPTPICQHIFIVCPSVMSPKIIPYQSENQKPLCFNPASALGGTKKNS